MDPQQLLKYLFEGGGGAVEKVSEQTGAQTNLAIWTPAAGFRYALTQLILCVGGVTAGTITIFDETNTAANHILVAEVAPSATLKYIQPIIFVPARRAAARDTSLRITTSAGITYNLVARGFEVKG